MGSLTALYALSGVRVFLWFGIILLVSGLITVVLEPLLVPLIISFTLYALFEPLNGYLARKNLGKTSSALIVLVVLALLIFAFVSIIFPLLAEQFQLLQDRLPVIFNALIENSKKLPERLGLPLEGEELVAPLIESSKNWGKTAIVQGSNLIISTTIVLMLVPLFTYFLIRDFRSFRNYMLDKLPNRSFELGWLIYYRVSSKLQIYIRGIMIQSVIVAIVTTIGFSFIGIESPVLLGSIAGILNLIPYVGALMAMVLPVLLALSHTPVDVALLGGAVGVILAAQLIDNVIVIPAVIANAVNLHPMIVVIGLIVFGTFFGFLGMILAIPAISTANIIYSGLKRGLKASVV